MIGLVMIVKNEADRLPRLAQSVEPLISHYTIVDTGSDDDTLAVARECFAGIKGDAVHRPWRGFGPSLTEAFQLAAGKTRWMLRCDADFELEMHPGLLDWLALLDGPPDAFNVEFEDTGLTWRLPLLLDGRRRDWRMVGPTHEYLDADGAFRTWDLTGLKVIHHADGSNREGKLERDLELLADGFEQLDPRSTFYTAECLRFLGRVEEAIAAYRLRQVMIGTWEEERWYAGYRAAQLARDEEGLLASWRERPHRTEPLTALRDLVAGRENHDRLFVESL